MAEACSFWAVVCSRMFQKAAATAPARRLCTCHSTSRGRFVARLSHTRCLQADHAACQRQDVGLRLDSSAAAVQMNIQGGLEAQGEESEPEGDHALGPKPLLKLAAVPMLALLAVLGL